MIKKIISSSDPKAAAYIKTPEFHRALFKKLHPASIAKNLPTLYSTDKIPMTEKAAAYCKTLEYRQKLEKLLPDSLVEKIPALRSTSKIPIPAKKVVIKFSTYDSNSTWFVFEGERLRDDDWLFFGLVEGISTETGYFLLSELCKVRGPWSGSIERDRYYSKGHWQYDVMRLGLN